MVNMKSLVKDDPKKSTTKYRYSPVVTVGRGEGTAWGYVGKEASQVRRKNAIYR